MRPPNSAPSNFFERMKEKKTCVTWFHHPYHPRRSNLTITMSRLIGRMRRSSHFGFETIFLLGLAVLIVVPTFASAQAPFALLTISPLQVQLNEGITLEWFCPLELVSWQGYSLPFIYAQITVTRIQEYPVSIAPYSSHYLGPGGNMSYTPPTVGTFTALLRCHYLGTAIGLGDFSCSSNLCKSGGEFVVTSSSTAAAAKGFYSYKSF